MKKKIFLCTLVALIAGAASAYAADVDGKWTAKMPARMGGKGGPPGAGGAPQEMVITFDFKASGDKLTGTMSGPGGNAVEISEGKIKGNDISFKIQRQFQERTMVMLYKGKVSGDEIKFTQSIEGVDRPPREFTAQRAK